MTAAQITTHVEVFTGDLGSGAYEWLQDSPVQSWDIETSGLDWRSDRIGTVQIYGRGRVFVVTRVDDRPELLKELLESPARRKLMHHAMFDLRFMAAAWNAAPANVACTKIAAKLLRVRQEQQSLAPLLDEHLGVRLDKSLQISDWSAELSHAQLAYAVGDVLYLEQLLARLRGELEVHGAWDLAEECFAHIPTRVALEIREYPDIFTY
jgi:ribonuclease D